MEAPIVMAGIAIGMVAAVWVVEWAMRPKVGGGKSSRAPRTAVTTRNGDELQASRRAA